MQFCEKCGNLLSVIKKRKRTYLYCKKCNKEYPMKKNMKFSEKIVGERREVIVIRREGEELPKTKIVCPVCGNVEAYWWTLQTRSADEPPTTFYRCTKCKYSWRSYD